MILAFADDFTVTVFSNIAEANTGCEGIDVEDGLYTFLDEEGTVLLPVFTEPNIRRKWGPLTSIESGIFTLVVGDERRPELLRAIIEGDISVDCGPRIRERDELIRKLRLAAGLTGL
ncbi:MAG: hypothetical protein V4726_14650 [Verrucomicrobiota bacterium]